MNKKNIVMDKNVLELLEKIVELLLRLFRR